MFLVLLVFLVFLLDMKDWKDMKELEDVLYYIINKKKENGGRKVSKKGKRKEKSVVCRVKSHERKIEQKDILRIKEELYGKVILIY